MAVKVVQTGAFDQAGCVEIIRDGVEIECLESEKGQAILYVKDVSDDTIAVFQYWSYAIVLDGIDALEASRGPTPIADEIEIPVNNGVEPQ